MFVHDATFIFTYENKATGMRDSRLVTFWGHNQEKLKKEIGIMLENGLDISSVNYSFRNWSNGFLKMYKEVK